MANLERIGCMYLIADIQNKMRIVPSERISTHCVVVKSPGSQVYLNFLFNGHFFAAKRIQKRLGIQTSSSFVNI